MPDPNEDTVIPYDPRIGGADPERRRAHISRDEARGRAWLPWESNGCGHGDKLHRICLDGAIQETGDRARQAASRKKPKAISSWQWEQGGR